jgi:hypothetical protein
MLAVFAEVDAVVADEEDVSVVELLGVIQCGNDLVVEFAYRLQALQPALPIVLRVFLRIPAFTLGGVVGGTTIALLVGQGIVPTYVVGLVGDVSFVVVRRLGRVAPSWEPARRSAGGFSLCGTWSAR